MKKYDKDIERIKNIIKSTSLNFLFGAGTSFCEEKKNHYPLMSHLVDALTNDSNFQDLRNYFEEDISQRIIIKTLIDKYLIEEKNFELFLSFLEGADNYITDKEVKEKTKELQKITKEVIVHRITSSDDTTVLNIYESFYKALRMLDYKPQSFNIFTTNYDMLNEKSMENIGTHYYSGFNGLVNRKFNIAYYDSKYINIYNIKNNDYALNESNHINLYKLHGSLSWEYSNGELFEYNPTVKEIDNPEIIYPSVSKFDNTNLIAYYSALMREFSNKICRADSTLIVCGTSLNDEHINKIIENALLIKSFSLIIFAYNEGLIEKLTNKYKEYDNAIVFQEKTNFEKLTSIIKGINADE